MPTAVDPGRARRFVWGKGDVEFLGRLAEHLPGKHNQQTHGNWAHGGRVYTGIEMQEALKAWTGSYDGDSIYPNKIVDAHEAIQQALSGNRSAFGGGASGDAAYQRNVERGEALLQMAADAPPTTQTIYRGMSMDDANFARWTGYTAGQSFDMNLQGHTSDLSVAREFAQGDASPTFGGNQRVMLRIAAGDTRAIDVNKSISTNPGRWEQEFLTAGTFRVKRASNDLSGDYAYALVLDVVQVSPARTAGDIGPLAEAAEDDIAKAIAQAVKVEDDLWTMTSGEITLLRQLLEQARRETIEALSQATKEWRIADRKDVLAALDATIARFGDTATKSLTKAQQDAWAAGASIGSATLSSAPAIDTRALLVAIETTPELITAVSDQVKSKVATMIRLATLGQASPLDLMKSMGTVAGKGVWADAFTRGEAIYRTEVGRMFSTSNFVRQQELEQNNPGWLKEWRAVHDSRTRPTHEIADGQRRPVNQPFIVGGFEAMYPHDPRLPARESVFCRCVSIAIRPEWGEPFGRPQKDEMLDDVAQGKGADVVRRLEKAASLSRVEAMKIELEAQLEALETLLDEVEVALGLATPGTEEYAILTARRDAIILQISRTRAALSAVSALEILRGE